MWKTDPRQSRPASGAVQDPHDVPFQNRTTCGGINTQGIRLKEKEEILKKISLKKSGTGKRETQSVPANQAVRCGNETLRTARKDAE